MALAFIKTFFIQDKIPLIVPSLARLPRLLRYVENWHDILLFQLGLKKSVVAKIRGGPKLLYTPRAFSLEQFVEQPYRVLDVEGKVVLDIGAFNGDSAIYFSMRGAKWVYAFEPYPYLYALAKANLELNGVSNVELFNEAVDAYEGWIRLDPNRVAMNAGAKDFGQGSLVRVRRLESVVRELGLEDAVLKIDCEGCEYGAILSADESTLDAFTQIIIEYHYQGYDSLKAKLEQRGFRVVLLDGLGRPTTRPPKALGLLYAKRSNQNEHPNKN